MMISRSSSIASITTAHNAASFLPRQIEALLRQSRPLDEIIVIDNGSTDGTAEMLAQRFPQVTVVRLTTNMGAAGGWAAGLKYAALERGHDWIWNFDDDSVPGESALEQIVYGAQDTFHDQHVGILAPLPMNETTKTYYPPQMWRNRFVRVPASEILHKKVWFADLVIASGSMIRREVVERLGVPRADFFMDFFDFEYCLRIRADGYKIAVINSCHFSHELGTARTFRFLGRTHVWPDHAPWREYYMSRNLTYAAQVLYPALEVRVSLGLELLRHSLAVLLFSKTRFSGLRKIGQGIIDGMHGRLGTRFLP